ncbi:hypothetical protein MAR_032077 [Mya arenaria]|uniref:Uncharacterized protein n=1 Tax=Mya arenaria TaxID=6604 RepID=A0ABY7F9W8_MYAAR|nr:hypothetical protein MAR_032077 [Mya arenaria]
MRDENTNTCASNPKCSFTVQKNFITNLNVKEKKQRIALTKIYVLCTIDFEVVPEFYARYTFNSLLSLSAFVTDRFTSAVFDVIPVDNTDITILHKVVLLHFFANTNRTPQVRDIGKKLRHAPKLKVTDDQLKQWFGQMRALLLVPNHLAANTKAQDTVNTLNKLELDQLQIERKDAMAAINDVIPHPKHPDNEDLDENVIMLNKIIKSLCNDILQEVSENKKLQNGVVDFIKTGSKPLAWLFQKLLSKSMTTHVTNRSKYTIYAKYSFNGPEVNIANQKAEASATAVVGGAYGANGIIGRGLEYSAAAAFRTIAPGAHMAFEYPTTIKDAVYIWIYYVDENSEKQWVCEGLPKRPDYSVFVDQDGKVQNAKHGTLSEPADKK